MAKQKISTLEKVGITAALTLLIALAIYFINYTRTHTKIITEPVYVSNVPVTGAFAEIAEVKTHWLERDGVVYPVAVITLGPASKSGSLRTFFRRDVGAIVGEARVIGDSNTLKFSDGKFENGTNSTTVECTKGLQGVAEFLGYKAQTDARWVIELREGKSGSRAASDFNKLAHVPIEPLLEESE